MKKRLLWLMTLAFSLIGLLSLVACGGGKSGTYKFYSIKMEEGGVNIELKAGEKFMGTVTLSDDFLTCEIKDDGTFVFSSSMEGFLGDSQTHSGTWVENADDSNKIDMTIDGDTKTWELSGGELRGEIADGCEVVLKK